MNKKKVVYIVSTLGRTGPTRQLHNIIKHLDVNLFSADIVTLSSNPLDNLEQEFKELGIKIHCLGLTRLSSIIFGKSQLIGVLKRLQPDIVHSQGLRSDLLATRLKGTYKNVATQRNNPLIDYPALMGSIKGTIAARLHIWAFNRLPLVVTCSKDIDTTNLKRNHTSKVIYNGVDLPGLTPKLTIGEKVTKRTQLNLPIDGRLFIYTGPLITRKNIIMLLKAFIDIDIEHTKSNLVILGDGHLKSDCQELAAGKENIFILGSVNNVNDYLQASDIFVSASCSEGMPNAVLEALAASLPVLLSDIGPHKEILSLSPKAGWLFPTNNRVILTNYLMKVLPTPENQETARQLTEKHFSAHNMSMEYQKVYLEL